MARANAASSSTPQARRLPASERSRRNLDPFDTTPSHDYDPKPSPVGEGTTESIGALPSSSGPHRRRAGGRVLTMTSMTRSTSTPTGLQYSPITTRSGKVVKSRGGVVGGTSTGSGAGFSPYARKSNGKELEAESTEETPRRVHGGLVGLVRGVAGKTFGYLFGGGSARAEQAVPNGHLSRSSTLSDLGAEEDAIEATGASRGRGLPSSLSSSSSMSTLAIKPRFQPSAAPLPRTQSSTNVQSATFTPSRYAPPPPSSLFNPVSSSSNNHGPRSSHSTLILPPSAATPNIISDRASRSRGNSPALSSTASYRNLRSNRSPSPTRSKLSGSMSAFNLAGTGHQYLPPLGSPNPKSTLFRSRTADLNSELGSNGEDATAIFGLTSKSPFAGTGATRSTSARFGGGGSPSVRSANSTAGSQHHHTQPNSNAAGNSLFPYASNLSRGSSASLQNMHAASNGSASHGHFRNGSSTYESPSSPKRSFKTLPVDYSSGSATLGSPRRQTTTGLQRSASAYNFMSTKTGVSSAFARTGSPLNPFLASGASARGGDMGDDNAERARKRQLVWDPEQGLVSREALERERERDAPPLPKNEAERILEVLEGMGRTPMGEAQRGAVRPKHISVPVSSPVDATIAALSPGTKKPRDRDSVSASPYGRRPKPNSETIRPGTGLGEVLRARDERRRAAEEHERKEREARRVEEEEERAFQNERNRKLREKREREQERMMSPEIDENDEAPRRKTRSMLATNTSTSLRKTPARASKDKGKAVVNSTAGKSKSKARSKSGRRDEETENEGHKSHDEDVTMENLGGHSSKHKIKSQDSTESSKMRFSPPQPEKSLLAEKPSLSAVSQQQQSSSLRPGRTHSSRSHVASSKVFSAREEDLPPVEDSDLGKIKLPAMVFPANFSIGSIGNSVSTANDGPRNDIFASKPVDAIPQSNLLSRINVPSNVTPQGQTSAPPAFATKLPAPLAFNTAEKQIPEPPASTTSSPVPHLPNSGSASSDFFSKPSPMPEPAPSVLPSSSKPNFFGSIVSNSAFSPAAHANPPNVAPESPFSFGVPVVKPSEVIEPTPATTGAVTPSNPFAAFGKPIAQIVNEGKAPLSPSMASNVPSNFFSAGPISSFGTSNVVLDGSNAKNNSTEGKKETSAPTTAPAFSFGSSTNGPSSASFSLKGDAGVDNRSPSPFAFGTGPVATNSAPPPSLFGASVSSKSVESGKDNKEVNPTGFNFGKAATASSDSAVPSVPAIDDNDEDSGMEDETVQQAPKSAMPNFSFGGPPTASPAGASVFGSTAPKPISFGAFSPSPSPAPQSPTINSTGFSFGQAASNSAPSTGAFTFGSSKTPNNNSSFGGAVPNPSTASMAPTALPSASSAARPFSFGSVNASTGTSSAPTTNIFGGGAVMSQTTSAPGFGGPLTPSVGNKQTVSPFGTIPTPGSPLPGATTTFNYGQPSQMTAASSGSPFSFGAPPSGNATPAFGGFGVPPTAGAASPFGGATGFTFGANVANPAAGSQSTPGTPAQGLFNLGSGGDDPASANKSGRRIAPMRRRK